MAIKLIFFKKHIIKAFDEEFLNLLKADYQKNNFKRVLTNKMNDIDNNIKIYTIENPYDLLYTFNMNISCIRFRNKFVIFIFR